MLIKSWVHSEETVTLYTTGSHYILLGNRFPQIFQTKDTFFFHDGMQNMNYALLNNTSGMYQINVRHSLYIQNKHQSNKTIQSFLMALGQIEYLKISTTPFDVMLNLSLWGGEWIVKLNSCMLSICLQSSVRKGGSYLSPSFLSCSLQSVAALFWWSKMSLGDSLYYFPW